MSLGSAQLCSLTPPGDPTAALEASPSLLRRPCPARCSVSGWIWALVPAGQDPGPARCHGQSLGCESRQQTFPAHPAPCPFPSPPRARGQGRASLPAPLAKQTNYQPRTSHDKRLTFTHHLTYPQKPRPPSHLSDVRQTPFESSKPHGKGSCPGQSRQMLLHLSCPSLGEHRTVIILRSIYIGTT